MQNIPLHWDDGNSEKISFALAPIILGAIFVSQAFAAPTFEPYSTAIDCPDTEELEFVPNA